MLRHHRVVRASLAGAACLFIIACNPQSGASGDAAYEVGAPAVSAEALRGAANDGEVRALYEKAGWTALWSDSSAEALTAAIRKATSHALDPGRFLSAALPDDAAQRDVALTKAALAYASALAHGVADPAAFREVYTITRPKADVGAGLLKAIETGSVDTFFEKLPPQSAEYEAMRKAFIDHLEDAGSETPSRIGDGDVIRPGDRDPRVRAIVGALIGNGYLDRASVGQNPGDRFTDAMADAVRQMQADYGVDADGTIGSETLKLLNTGARERARQLAINLERLRWLDRDPPGTRIDVNTAAAMLTYVRDGKAVDRRRVVVGEAGWETPQLGSPITRLVVNPTWTVPKSIEEEELADKDPAYFRRNNMERRDGWIVQKPGDDNALGRVKFDMANDESIYLHDTPHKGLFSASQRHRSHGCVRVDDALSFAMMLADDQGIRAEVEKALPTMKESFVRLPEPIPVRLIYQTAFLEGGRIRFRADPYGWDEDVARALGRQSSERRTPKGHRDGARDIGP